MPKRKIKADPAYQLARDLTEHSTRMLLPVVYNEGAFAERDVIRLRTNYRKDEDVYLYRVNVQPGVARAMFLTYVTYLNKLKDNPEWYNELTRNCTTTLVKPLAADVNNPQPWSYRFLLNGTLDELLYDRRRLITGGLPFPELKQRAHINAAAHTSNHSPDFSALIRAGRIGF